MRSVVVVVGLIAGCAAATAAPDTMTFRDACAPGERITLAAVGDVLIHRSMQAQALRKGGSYRQFWRELEPVLNGADITYGNMEGSAAPGVLAGGRAARDPGRRYDGRVYGDPSGVLYYNYHPSLIDDLKSSGFDIVSTANNHALDRSSLGVDRTIDGLRARGMAFAGTRKRGEFVGPWSTITEVKGFRIGWIACTWGVNGNRDPEAQVLNCHRQRDELLHEVGRLHADPAIDAVIVTPHWGEEGDRRPRTREKQLATDLIEAGATAVIGAHPHVLQPWEQITASDGREGLVIYSTGNFVSNQVKPQQRAGIVAVVELTRSDNGRARITAAGFVPTWVDRRRGGNNRVTENRNAVNLRDPLKTLPAGNRLALNRWNALPRTCTIASGG